ncbi:ATP-dependent transcriptional regulator [Pseudomonas aeruginosa]|uniref:LuxR C-terminal-related transcriptional regulator n=1 Tax=Pseudomonas aeruginosa group TaxID=136841 RepID=UPI0009A2F463|nr:MULTISPECIES: LuxR C-terminal-related transcriptional regulator [Pseudomonas aeruginosa group]KSP92600.2 ATP-dependent transcriptional regulator [Pseudomonas aeruginosa]MBG7372724.1 ATP-dependent transcriptional regulator [Pseudomonas aeruginosa]MCW8021412.1 LuxR C-terminal-related transcriptional regulator [Pseudomonas aeruginosa]MDK2349936.1 LuxR C-terminal-related transcriptional regulator [Pseudomonas paraeruginosa]MEA8483671.1 LuxR C-terminal-related transcriptional regulator [Pseudomo
MQSSLMNSDDLLVATKFSPPRLNTRHIPRTQLLERLHEARLGNLTLITGGAGFGKTLLLAQWRQALLKEGLDVAWLSLSHDDRQYPSFLAYLLAALQRLGIAVESGLALDDAGESTLAALVALVTRQAERAGRELYLLIDDYHHVEAPLAHRLLQKLLDHCPANLHLVIASRSTPPLSLGRLRMQGQVAEIDFAELPFDLEETRAFFEHNLGSLRLTADEEQLIHELTGGWPASLQPIATMLRIRPARRPKLRSLLWKSSDLQAYLAEDVVACLAPELIGLLEQLSPFRRFNADLAAFVTGSTQAAALIQRAEDENLLIYRVDSEDSMPWYRFHPLFGEFLGQRLAMRGAAAVEALHRRASQWFAEHELLVESVRHANLGGDLDFAVAAMEQAASTAWSMACISPMLHLLERLPQETLFGHPRLFIVGCLTYAFTARPEKAERWLEQIRRTEAAKNPALSSRFALADAAVALQLDNPRRVIGLLEPAQRAPLENRSLRYISLSALATAYLLLGRVDAVHRLHEDNPILAEDRDNDMALVYESTLILALLRGGDAAEAARLGGNLLARAEAGYGRSSVSASLCAANLCDAYYELDRIDEALAVLANRNGILQSSMPDVMARASVCRARIAALRESPQALQEFLETQTAHFHKLGLDRPQALMLAEQAKTWLAQGDLRRASERVVRLETLAEGYRGDCRDEVTTIAAFARARLALAEREPARALECLARVGGFAERYGRGRTAVKARLLAAIAHTELGQEQEGMDCLAAVLQDAARFGLVRTLLDEGPRLSALLERLAEEGRLEGPCGAYLDELLTRGGRDAEAAEPVAARRAPGAEPRSILTPREVEILGLIAQAMSNKRIALTLNITFGTVKWNVKNILAKLGVSSRYAAISLARQQGVIP